MTQKYFSPSLCLVMWCLMHAAVCDVYISYVCLIQKVDNWCRLVCKWFIVMLLIFEIHFTWFQMSFFVQLLRREDVRVVPISGSISDGQRNTCSLHLWHSQSREISQAPYLYLHTMPACWPRGVYTLHTSLGILHPLTLFLMQCQW